MIKSIHTIKNIIVQLIKAKSEYVLGFFALQSLMTERINMKKLKNSRRGLTFSLNSDDIAIGTKYRYVISKEKKEVLIIPDENGTMTVSRKKCGKRFKPLFDIRSREVKSLVEAADYLEVEVLSDKIIVHAYKNAKISIFRKKICSISEVLGVKQGEIILQRAAGGENIAVSEAYAEYDASYGSDLDEITSEKLKGDAKAVYDVISLFSGAGLFDKAWLDSGRFRFVYANDFDKNVFGTYTRNIGNHMHIKDIREVRSEELPFADVFLTSPCCQAFSNANRKNAKTKVGEEKRLLVDEVIRLAIEKQPKVVVIENVPGFITSEDGLYLSRVFEGMSGYEISVQVVKDHEVGGYSKRERAIIICSKIGKIELPQVKTLTYKTVKEALAKVDATWYNYADVTQPSEKTKEKMSYVPQGGNWRDIPTEINTYGPNTQSNIMRRLREDEPSITLSNFRKSNILHPTQNRILTVSEAAAIMGLEKDFQFVSDSLSAMQQMVANGVTQAISKFVRNAVLRKLDAYTLAQQSV